MDRLREACDRRRIGADCCMGVACFRRQPVSMFDAATTCLRRCAAKACHPSRATPRFAYSSLSFEPLEPRLPLSAAGLVDVGTQPHGGLSGKIVYIHGGHGYTADNEGNGAWSFQRSELFEMIEDLGNVDQMTFLADYLFRAGATVVPLRPVGHQTNEVVLDNDDAGVTFAGNWSNSSASVYFGSAGDVPYRFATTSLTETAYARYQPNHSAGRLLSCVRLDVFRRQPRHRPALPRESLGRHHRGHGQSPPRRQRAGLPRHVLFRRRHRRLRRHQQPLEQLPATRSSPT